MPDPHLSIQQSKWSTRAWTYQEGLFSIRRLFFTDYQVYFECNAMNCVESFKSNLKILHIQNGQRYRAGHRTGKFVCGNSNPYSHLNVRQTAANHRKIDTIRRCQYQICQYTKRELTKKDDILNAFAGIASFYATTNARIASLAGIPIPFPIAKLRNSIAQEGLDHLSYALAWTHHVHTLGESKLDNVGNEPGFASEQLPGNIHDLKPKRREGFPSWSWAGWFGHVEKRCDLPYFWTSHLSSVRIDFREGDPEDYARLQNTPRYKQYLIRKLLTANVLHFDAYVLNPEKLRVWGKDPDIPFIHAVFHNIQVHLSKGPYSLRELRQKLMDGEFECLVIGTYGEPRKDIFRAIKMADKKNPGARNSRIESFERLEPEALVCLITRRVGEASYRVGLLKARFPDSRADMALTSWSLGAKRRFSLRQRSRT